MRLEYLHGLEYTDGSLRRLGTAFLAVVVASASSVAAPALVQQVGERLPQDTEQQALQAVREVARLEPASEQAADAFVLKDDARGFACEIREEKRG